MDISLNQWKGKVAIVTGASSGIGKAVSMMLATYGVQVVALARRVEMVKEFSDKLKKNGKVIHALKANVTKEEDIVNAFEWTTKNVGPIHILINNAAYLGKKGLLDGDTEQWDQTLKTNVLGLCVATREAIKDMRRNHVNGHIIHINSIVGHKVIDVRCFNLYPATKHAITALTETLRQELNFVGSKIKVTSVSPGFVNTPFVPMSDLKIDLTKEPVLEPEDVANAICYALSTPPHVQVYEITIKAIGEKF